LLAEPYIHQYRTRWSSTALYSSSAVLVLGHGKLVVVANRATRRRRSPKHTLIVAYLYKVPYCAGATLACPQKVILAEK